MNGLVLTLHILVSVLLIGGILLQPGSKGGGLGATFGGGGANTAFGARGAAPFLAKATYYLAAAFFATSLIIEIKIVHDQKSVLEKVETGTTTPAAPAPVIPSAPKAPAPSPAPAGK